MDLAQKREFELYGYLLAGRRLRRLASLRDQRQFCSANEAKNQIAYMQQQQQQQSIRARLAYLAGR